MILATITQKKGKKEGEQATKGNLQLTRGVEKVKRQKIGGAPGPTKEKRNGGWTSPGLEKNKEEVKNGTKGGSRVGWDPSPYDGRGGQQDKGTEKKGIRTRVVTKDKNEARKLLV